MVRLVENLSSSLTIRSLFFLKPSGLPNTQSYPVLDISDNFEKSPMLQVPGSWFQLNPVSSGSQAASWSLHTVFFFLGNYFFSGHQSNIVFTVNFLSSSEPPSLLLASLQLNILVIFLLSLHMNFCLSPELPFFFAVWMFLLSLQLKVYWQCLICSCTVSCVCLRILRCDQA